MTVSKVDLLNKRFGRAFRGYHRAEVDAFMQETAEVMGRLAEERRSLADRIALLEGQIEDHKAREDTLRDTLVTTQRMVEDLKANARKEAQLIVDEAQTRARQMMNQAHQRLSQVHEDIADLKRRRAQFEVKLKGLIEAHLRLLEMEDKEEERVDALESKLSFATRTR